MSIPQSNPAFGKYDIDEVIRILPRYYNIRNIVLIGDNGYELRFAWSDGKRSGDITLHYRAVRKLIEIALDEQHRRIIAEDYMRIRCMRIIKNPMTFSECQSERMKILKQAMSSELGTEQFLLNVILQLILERNGYLLENPYYSLPTGDEG